MSFECTANNHMQTVNTKGVDHYDKQLFVRCLDIVIAIIWSMYMYDAYNCTVTDSHIDMCYVSKKCL